MLKLTGAVCVFLASALFGGALYRRLVQRVRQLDGLKQAFLMLQTEIVFLQTPLPQAVLNIAAATQDAVFAEFGAQLACGAPPPQAMQRALLSQQLLTAADGRVLQQAALALGSSDAQAQRLHIDAIQTQLSTQLAEARQCLQGNGRLCVAGGFLGGLLLVILLL